MPCHCAHERINAALGLESAADPSSDKAPHNDLEGFCEADAVKHYAPNLVLEPVHIDIAADFDFTATTLHATITHTVRSNRTVTAESSEALRDAATTLELNGVSFDNVKVTGDGVAGFEYDGQIIAVKFNGPATTKGDERKIVISYSVQRPVSGLFWNIAERDLATNGTYIITDHETERARYWLATVDYPTVRTTLTFHLTAPEHMTAVANGIEVSAKPAAVAGRKTTSWHLDYPCPSYLLCVAVGDFTVAEDRDAVLDDGRKIPVKYYATKNYSAEELMITFKATPGMIEWISKRFMFDMPWFKYSQIASPYIGGAMEDISLVTWGSFAIVNARHARDFGFLIDAVNIHEMGHSFFGDATVVRYV
ncbi:peptidase M1, membrane alanine aminopeptidase, partial [Blastocladiella britannica]